MVTARRRWVTRVAIGLAAVATVGVGSRWVLHSHYFCVQKVAITGLTHESVATALSVTGLDRDPPMVDVSTSAVARSLETLPWVAHANVIERWPHTIDITVTPAVPVAVARTTAGQLWLVTATGRQIAPVATSSSLPLLVAQSATSQSDAWPFTGWASAAAAVAAQLPPAFSSQVAEVTISTDGEVALQLTSPLTLALGPPTQLHAKFVAAAAVLARADLLHAGDTVDLSVPTAPTVSGPA